MHRVYKSPNRVFRAPIELSARPWSCAAGTQWTGDQSVCTLGFDGSLSPSFASCFVVDARDSFDRDPALQERGRDWINGSLFCQPTRNRHASSMHPAGGTPIKIRLGPSEK